jgi:hypothetical protein
MNRHLLFVLVVAFAIALFSSCEKEITVDLPVAPEQIVVEGSIEQGQPPVVFLTRSQGYFEPTSITALQDLIVTGAQVFVSNGEVEVQLDEVCSDNVPEDLLPLITEATGFTPEQLQFINLCLYTTSNTAVWGEENTIYDLRVEVEGKTLTSRTKINNLVELDSVWFEIPGQVDEEDSLGFTYAILTDPDTLGNAYRWFARRINRYPEWSPNAGEVKDQAFIAPFGSAIDDAFFNGLSFEFGFFRGALPNSTKEDDRNEEAGFYKVGDTVVIRGCVIDRGALAFITSLEDQVASQGSPFASPANIQSNIEGGLGAWIGYGASYDTIVCAAP